MCAPLLLMSLRVCLGGLSMATMLGGGVNGTPCSLPGECASDLCVDGFCCDTNCLGICQVCDLAGLEGTCSPAAAGTDPDSECSAGLTCDGAGDCNGTNGAPCAVAGQCSSNVCVDGVCCDTDCLGTCEACDLLASEGTCSLIPAGTDPVEECPGASTCDGTGICSTANGTPCSVDAQCISNACEDGICCNTVCAGSCEACDVAGLEGTCTLVPAGTDPDDECAGASNCDGAGVCTQADGSACFLGTQCTSGRCVDGVCCATDCLATCQACDVAGLEGICSAIPAGTNPDGECPGASTCDGVGTCSGANGSPCAFAAQCISGRCVDGLCCNLDCLGTCQACNLAGSEGFCTLVPAGSDPDDECPGVSNCDGGGACTAANGSPCLLSSQCDSGFCVDGVCCATDCPGTCLACDVAGLEGICSPIPVGTNPDGECPGASTCDGIGACSGANGSPCAFAAQCISGLCVDGFCCSTDCTGDCQACNLAGSEGFCTVIPAGTDPDAECLDASTCDGAGQCTQADGATCFLDTQCTSGLCVDGVCCDTNCLGSCQACDLIGSEGTCSAIPAGTDPDAECPGASTCDGAGGCSGVDGTSCSVPAECISGNCADGFCCDAECSGVCEACNLAGLEGTCTAVPAGDDPDDECLALSTCDGGGQCSQDVGAPCTGSAQCIGGLCVDGFCCDTVCLGTCQACNVTGLEGACSPIPAGTDPDADCQVGFTCDGAGICIGIDGTACSLPADCLSGSCVDGLCCDDDCLGTCRACDVAGVEGTCSNVPAGTDPDGECPVDSTCDGASNCSGVNGTPCSLPSECASDFCEDGLCCATECLGICESCNLLGLQGTCSPDPVGTDPEGDCAVGFICNGTGGCSSDVDGDGVPDVTDACDNTPAGIVVDSAGRPKGDLDLDCDVDLQDHAIQADNLTGPL